MCYMYTHIHTYTHTHTHIVIYMYSYMCTPWLRALVAQVCALGPPGLAAQKKKILKSQCPNNLLHKCPCKEYF